MPLRPRAEAPPLSDDRVVNTLASAVYERLRRDILHGALAPSLKLQIDNLRERYGAGGTPIREALNRLSAEGLVMREEQRGFQVAPVSVTELEELVRTRSLMNEICVRESLARGDEAWEESVVLAFHRLIRSPDATVDLTEARCSPEWERRHSIFHISLISACGSRLLIDFYESLFERAERYRNWVQSSHTLVRDLESEHRSIMEAVVNRRTSEAILLLNQHLEWTAENVIKILQNNDGG